MSSVFQTARTLGVATGSMAAWVTPSAAAQELAHTPTISGHSWIALVIIGGFIVTIFLLIAGALHVERRDAYLGRGRSRGEHGWFGLYRVDDDDYDDSNGGEGN